ncbi:BlaI/MecI/CopY family transcriptional regulator [Apilactobacillus ozensis]|uniref:BlaI/MecI/CopY family transcriptional regulator n=1 Tax=Apilactobacillus ozensis TaxID=866801 RepID=UPI000B164143
MKYYPVKKGWSASTIKTLIGRLLTKNALKSDKQKKKKIFILQILMNKMLVN